MIKNLSIHSKLASLLVLILSFISHKIYTQTLSTTLPIVVIDVENNGNVTDYTKVTAKMKIIDNGTTNTDFDVPNQYDGYIGIEFRGSSSQIFPKKAYSIETRNADGSDNDVSIFGWPKESDWILYASYNEKSLMHNVFAMQLARKLGMYASRTKYVEVIVNGSYMGVYVFMEKIKVAKGRVNIAKLNPEDIEGDELTGGYIVKIDKTTGVSNGGWVSSSLSSSVPQRQIYFQYDAPKDINAVQQTYIKNYVEQFESALKSKTFMDSIEGYRKYADVKSFMKYFLVNEVARNIDGYRLSTYLYKDKDSKGGKLTIGPPWDYDIAFGNADYCQGDRFNIWGYQFGNICPDDGFQLPFWWDRMLQDTNFVKALRNEYDSLRKDGILKTSNLHAIVDSLQNVLQVPQKRNFTKWPIIGQYVWPSPSPVASTWEGEVAELKNWLTNRMTWLDANMPRVLPKQPENYNGGTKLKIYPNPSELTAKIELYINEDRLVIWQLYDESGRLLCTFNRFHKDGKNLLDLNDVNFSAQLQKKGQYYLKAIVGTEEVIQKITRL